jgi:hypothetical protein
MLTMRHRQLTILAMLAVLQPTAAHAEPPADALNFTATSANVKEPGSPVKIHLIRWSTDEERNPVVAALNPSAAAPSGQNAARGLTPAAGGRAGRGGRGGARGGRGNAAAPPTPIAALTAAIGRAPTIGYIWTNDVTGYSIKYAYHASLPDGGERIILAADRRLGAYSPAWKPLGAEASAKAALGAEASAKAADYDFTLVEIRLDAGGMGEGKTSLTTKVVADDQAKTIALDDYAATPATLQKVEKVKVQRAK